jgi:solute carrier family 25 S-adenosylmethionine transporter 26
MIAGGVAAVSTTPLDVVKTRVMLEARVSVAQSKWEGSSSQTAANSAGAQQSPSVLSFPPRLLAIARNEGFSALFRGWQPRTLAISFGGAVFLGIYDFAVNFGKTRQEEPSAL